MIFYQIYQLCKQFLGWLPWINQIPDECGRFTPHANTDQNHPFLVVPNLARREILFESSLYSIHRSPSLYSSIFLINATSSPIYYSGAKTGLLIQRLTTYVFHPNWTLKTTDGAVTQLTTSCCKLWNRSIRSTNFHRRCSISVLQSSQFFFCSEQIMSADKCSNIYPRQMEGIVLPIPSSRDARSTLKVFCLPYICSLERGGREQTKTHWGIEEGRMKRAKGKERVFILFLPRSRSLNGCRLPSRRTLSL